MSDRPEVVVVGGGITGLATAWFLRDQARVTLLEAAPAPGAKLATGHLAGRTVELGPDTFLARDGYAVGLCREVGLGDDLVEPATGRAFLWIGGHLRPIPPGVLGVPTRLGPLVKARVLSWRGVARAGADFVLPRRRWGPDPSVAEVIGGRLGSQVLTRLVEPLVGGINAGTADRLSLASAAPALATAAEGNRSLLVGLRRVGRNPPTVTGPLFLGVRGGMGRLAEHLARSVSAAGIEIRTGTEVSSISGSDDGHTVVTTANDTLVADRVVLSVPAFAAAPILRTASPGAAAELERIRYASVAVVSLAYPVASFVDGPPTGAGFLVPRSEGRLMTACTFTSAKWPQPAPPGRAADDLFVVRASAGRAGDDRAMAMTDEELVSHLHGELAMAVGVRSSPRSTLVTRWPRGLPQYEPGHSGRVDRIEAALGNDLPGVVLAGAAYRGLGIAACIRQAREAAARP